MTADTLEDVLAWLNEGLAKALVVDGPEGIAKAAWVPIDRVLLARDRLAVIIDDAPESGAVNCSTCGHPYLAHVPHPEGFWCRECRCKRRFLR
jgi:hypothetical protein